ncbi:MAG TPA: MmcQ/YjbR family DNA-binding protein [Flavobacteriales bacterium]|jgi:predicted DNA-binding protein (MmcQ/YjbR family)|nr:MmcQ/YjbR family DNA-binding protein [Flavobacteriales bacterium]
MKLELIQDINHEVNAETILEFVSKLPGVTQGFPFDNKTLVFKVGNKAKEKIFALLDIEDFKSVNLKCNPERSVKLRSEFEGVIPGWHMNKKHWNTVSPLPISDVPPKLFWELLLHSYSTVRNSLPVKVRNDLN